MTSHRGHVQATSVTNQRDRAAVARTPALLRPGGPGCSGASIRALGRRWGGSSDARRNDVQEAGYKVARGLKGAGGRGPRYLFSGLMRCEACGSSFVVQDKQTYQCSGFVNGRICGNSYRVRRDVVQQEFLLGSTTIY